MQQCSPPAQLLAKHLKSHYHKEVVPFCAPHQSRNTQEMRDTQEIRLAGEWTLRIAHRLHPLAKAVLRPWQNVHTALVSNSRLSRDTLTLFPGICSEAAKTGNTKLKGNKQLMATVLKYQDARTSLNAADQSPNSGHGMRLTILPACSSYHHCGVSPAQRKANQQTPYRCSRLPSC